MRPFLARVETAGYGRVRGRTIRTDPPSLCTAVSDQLRLTGGGYSGGECGGHPNWEDFTCKQNLFCSCAAIYAQLRDEPLQCTTPGSIVDAMRTRGCALLRRTIIADHLELMRTELLGYTHGTPGNDGQGAVGSRSFTELFQRHPCWLGLLDPPYPLAFGVLQTLLGEGFKVISQKGLRHAPGHNDPRVEADNLGVSSWPAFDDPIGGFHAARRDNDPSKGFHADLVFAPLPEAVAALEEVEVPLLIITMYTYVNGTDRLRCPTRVIEGSHNYPAVSQMKTATRPGGRVTRQKVRRPPGWTPAVFQCHPMCLALPRTLTVVST